MSGVVWYSEAGDPAAPNEDAEAVTDAGAVVVVDGGVARFARQLAEHIGAGVDDPRGLVAVLADAIAAARLHPGLRPGPPGHAGGRGRHRPALNQRRSPLGAPGPSSPQ